MASSAGSPPIPAQNQQQHYAPMTEFQAGVTACLRSWSPFRTAVESGWGGGERESQKKAEDLRQSIYEVLNGRKCPVPNYDVYDLTDSLAIYVEEEFSVQLEDESDRQVAETIYQMYEDCCNGNPALARQMVVQASSAVALNSQFPVKIQTSEHDDDDDEDMIDGSTTTDNLPIEQQQQQHELLQPNSMIAYSPADYINQPLFGKPIKTTYPAKPSRQLGETTPEDSPLEMDEDGFAPVMKGNRQRK